MQLGFYSLFFCFVLLFAGTCFGQEKVPDGERLVICDPGLPAEFLGGRDSLRRFLSENLRYPSGGICITGTCYIRFTVEEDGSISDVKVMRGVQDCLECDAEAVRVIKLMPKWNAAKFKGKPEKSYFDLPVRFSITR